MKREDVVMAGVPAEAPSHTPGPWYAKQGCIYSRAHETNYGPNPADAPYIWRVVGSVHGKTEGEIEANEALIAAAPTLVQELEDAADMLHELALECAHCNYGDGATGKSSDDGVCEECSPTREAERRAREAVAQARGQQS